MANGRPVSGRQVRRAVGDSIATINAHAEGLHALDAALGKVVAEQARHAAALNVHLAASQTFLGRLRWLFRGYPA